MGLTFLFLGYFMTKPPPSNQPSFHWKCGVIMYIRIFGNYFVTFVRISVTENNEMPILSAFKLFLTRV